MGSGEIVLLPPVMLSATKHLSNVKLSVYNALGQVQETLRYAQSDVPINIDASQWESGLYFIQIQMDDPGTGSGVVKTVKVVKQ